MSGVTDQRLSMIPFYAPEGSYVSEIPSPETKQQSLQNWCLCSAPHALNTQAWEQQLEGSSRGGPR